MPASLVRLKVTLDHVEPTVMRRVVVPLRIKLHRLHEVLQAAMGWTNSHLYEFRIRDVGFGLADQDWGDGPLDARKISLLAAIEDIGAKSFKYLYDFGDGWTHSIKIERTFPVWALRSPCSSKQPAAALPRTSADRGAIRSSARLSPIRPTSAMPSSSNGGAARITIRTRPTSPSNKAVDDLAANWARKSRREI